MNFVVKSMNLIYYIYGSVCVEPSVCPKDKVSYVMMYNLSDICLYSGCEYFIESFLNCVHLGY